MAQSIITFTTGSVGTGKSYSKARWIVTEYLPQYDGVLYTNFPLKKDVVVEYCSKRYKLDKDDLDRRIQFIPENVLDDWRDGVSGPWEYFKDIDITNSHILIDEAHNFCENGLRTDPRVKQWVTFFGEIRHRGCTIEFVTQDLGNLPPAIREKSQVNTRIVTCETEFDTIFKIPYSDWYELRAAFIREYVPRIAEVKESEGLKGKRKCHRMYYRDKFYYQFYDSYVKPVAGGLAGKAQLHEFQRRTRLGVCWWFFKRNFPPLITWFSVFLLAIWGMYGGGAFIFGDLITGYFGSALGSGVTSTVQAAPQDIPVKINNVAVTDQQVELSEIDKLKNEIEQLKLKNDRLISDIGYNSSVTMITPDYVILNNGYIYKKGEIIDYGFYKNKKISTIDYEKRCFSFTDGSVVRLGLLRQSSTSE